MKFAVQSRRPIDSTVVPDNGLTQALSLSLWFPVASRTQRIFENENVFGQFERASNLNLVLPSPTYQLKTGDTKDEPCPQLFRDEAVACKCLT